MKNIILIGSFLLFSHICFSQVTGITLNTSTATISTLSTVQLSVTFSPTGASTPITWTSTNTDVAFVNSSGKIYGLSNGQATITASANGGALSATCSITVTDSKNITQTEAIFMTTNFVIPLVRFGLLQKDAQGTAIGNGSFFNSVGAGVSFNLGKLTVTQTPGSAIEQDQEFENHLGLQLGVLFAVNSSAQNNANIFAPTISLTTLNFQFGAGYELGNVGTNDTRFFFTIAYGIPIPKLIKGGYARLYTSKKSSVNGQSKVSTVPNYKTYINTKF